MFLGFAVLLILLLLFVLEKERIANNTGFYSEVVSGLSSLAAPRLFAENSEVLRLPPPKTRLRFLNLTT